MNESKNTRRFKTASGLSWMVLAWAIFSLQGCAVVSVADAAVTVVATGVKTAAKAVGAAANAVIP